MKAKSASLKIFSGFAAAMLIAQIFVFAGNAHAAPGVPGIISYQGRLANSSGDLLGGSGATYYFRFGIWNGVSGGSRLWPSGAGDPCSHALTVRDGVFNAGVGDISECADVLDYSFRDTNSAWLQVEVSSNGSSWETLSPRQRIASAVFAQLAAAVSGAGQSSFGTTTPVSGAVATFEATTTSAIPAVIRGAVGQLANLFRVVDSSLNHLFSIDYTGGIFASSTFLVGTSTPTSFIINSVGAAIGSLVPTRKFNVVGADSVPQLRVGQSASVYGEMYVDSAGDVRVSATGGNVRQNDENLWVCSGGSCGVSTPASKGNAIVERAVIFGNKFYLQQTDASTTIMYDTIDSAVLQFDEATTSP